MKLKHLNLLFLCFALAVSCNNEPKKETGSPTESAVKVETSQDKSQLEAYYQLPHIKEWYTERILPPAFDFKMDLSGKSFQELRLLRNEIYARNGYLFDESDLRGYFNQFKWYQPIFDVEDFKVYLTKEEQDFVQKVEKLEQDKLKAKYVQLEGNKLINMDHVVNTVQFTSLDKNLFQSLKTKNFAIVPGDHEQLFYVYDNNQYQYIPNFITTDLYVQLMHKYLSGQMQEIEEEKLIDIVSKLLSGLYQKSSQELKTQPSPATAWANTYLAIASTAISGEKVAVSSAMSQLYEEECRNISDASGNSSDFLNLDFMDYSTFKPRGNYTKSEELKRYFKCVKWLNSAPVNVADQEKFEAVLQMAFWIKSDPSLLKKFNTFSDVLLLLAGEEDNVSFTHLIRILDKTGVDKIEKISQPAYQEKIKVEIAKLDVNKIRAAGTKKSVTDILNQTQVLFSAGRYSFDAEIFTKLISVARNPVPKRPFPKSLDVFASLGNKTAESILMNTYNEGKQWAKYPDSLAKLKKQFGNYKQWDKNIYNKTMQAINALNAPVDKNAPLFMQTIAWQKKNLITSLAGYTQLKHDMILYSEQPYAAEAGQGGGPPPPKQLSYVEPNVAFWQKAIELLDFQQEKLLQLHLLTHDSKEINSEMKTLAKFLLDISNKELQGKQISDEEFMRLNWLGGEVERLTFRIIKSDHLPEREKQIALIADVYAFNTTYLESAIGLADEIYVITEINGLPYLTRGACFSYYEFTSNKRYSDEEWQKDLSKGKAPARPIWMKDLYIQTKPLKSKASYSF